MRSLSSESPVTNYHKQIFRLPEGSVEHLLPMRSPGLEAFDAAGIRLCGLSDLVAGYRVCRPQATISLVLCVIEGEGICSIDDSWRTLSAGDAFYSPTGISQLYGVDSRLKMIWFHLERPVPEFPQPVILQARRNIDSLTHPFNGILNELHSGHGHPIPVAAYAEILVFLLRRLLRLNEPENREPAYDRRYASLEQAINRNPGRRWTVEALADVASVSPSHLFKITQAAARIRPMELVRKIRMEWAQEMLMRSDFPLKHIAARIGYDNAYSFSKAYKSHFGENPSSTRASSRSIV